MPALGINANLNLIRHYRFNFYTITGNGPYTVVPTNNVIQDSVNFSFNYSIASSLRNTANFTFYNLSEQSIGLFTSQTKNVSFSFDAWYGDNNKGDITIFRGSTSIVNTYRDGPDIITEVTASDLFTNLLLPSGFQQQFPPGTPFLTIIQTICSLYGAGLTLDPGSAQYLTGSYKTWKTFLGSRDKVIKQVTSDAGCLYAIHLNTLIIFPNTFKVASTAIYQKINKNNGLVGYPRAISLSAQLLPPAVFSGINLNQNLSLISVSTLLRNYKVNTTVIVESENFNGPYVIMYVNHNGEWRGNSWYSNLTLIPLAEG